jgi:hypothetical protein
MVYHAASVSQPHCGRNDVECTFVTISSFTSEHYTTSEDIAKYDMYYYGQRI